jgi:type VI secretion system secreted protein VgrG
MPAWALPDQTHLAGIRSRELGGWRGNHLVLDDTPRKIQAQLRSDHQSSSLSLGHIARIEDTAGRKDDRGQGFELRTDGHGAIRAKDGLLITTEPRPDARAHITDMGETIARLASGRDLHESLSEAAQQAKAHDAGDQDEVTEALKEQNDEIRGQGGNTEQGHFPEFQQPHLTLASPESIQTTSQGSTHIASGEHNALTSGGHTSISAGKSFLVSARNAVRMFACNAGMRLTAASSDIDITALKNSINLLARLNIKLEAERITITAREEVVIVGGGSFSRWNDSGIVHGTSGLWREHAATHSFAGPKSLPVQMQPLPSVNKASWIELNHAYDDLEPVKGAPYRLIFDNGKVISGKLDDKGFARHDGVPDGSARVEWGEDERRWGGETKRPNDRFEAAQTALSAIDLVMGLPS